MNQPKKTKGKPGRKTLFSPKEEERLLELVKVHGENKWSVIASVMKKWNRKQLRDHYVNFMKGQGSSTNFSPAEDVMVLTHVNSYGHTWKELSKKLPGRSPMAIKNRYYKILNKRNNSSKNDSYSIKLDCHSEKRNSNNNTGSESAPEVEIDPNDQLSLLIAQYKKLYTVTGLLEARLNDSLKVREECK